MVKMAALAPKGVFEEEDFYVPAWEEPPVRAAFRRLYAQLRRESKHGAPHLLVRAPLSFQILRSRRPYAGTAVRRGCWGCPSDT